MKRREKPMQVRCGHCRRRFGTRQAVAAHPRTCRAADLDAKIAELQRELVAFIDGEARTQAMHMLTLIHFEPEPGQEPN